MSAEIKKEIEQIVEALKKVKDGDNIEDIKQKSAELSQVIQKIGAELYKASQEKKPGEGEEDKSSSSPSANAREDEEPKAEEGEYKETRQ